MTKRVRKVKGMRNGGVRVIIRPLAARDCDAFIRAVRQSRKLHAPWVAAKARTRKEFAKYLKRFSSERNFGFLVIERASGGLVGMININEVIRGAFQSGALGYFAFVPFGGKGLMSEGMALVLKQAFGKLKLHRVEANIQAGNRGSIALVKKFHFAREGFSRRMLKINGKWKDHERWALLTEDFRARKTGILAAR